MIKFFKILFARFWVFQSVAFPVYLGSGAILKEARPSFNHKGEGRKKGFGMENRDLVIIGGGPAGYIAALRAVQYGIAPTLVEEKALGGTCLNCGCIPTKFLLHSAEIYQSIKDGGQYGINVSGVGFDLSAMQDGKNRVIKALVSGVQGHLKRGKVEVVQGRAKLKSAKQVEIDSGQTIRAEKIIIATGSRPAILPILGADNPEIMNPEHILALKELPRSIVIIGGGAIGVEMATFLARFGSKVSILEMMPQCLPAQDAEIVSVLQDVFKQDGIDWYCGVQANSIEDDGESKRVVFSDGNSEKTIEAEAVAICAGYKPNIEGLGLEECGVEVEQGAIKVNGKMETSIPGIYAAGDVVGGMMLAYVAFAEGMVAADNAAGKHAEMDYGVVPQCIFTSPEIASVGLTEEEARAQGHGLKIGRFPFIANGMAHILGEYRGLVKIVSEPRYGQILGVHIIGPRATSLIQEVALAMKLEATPEDIARTLHPHPNLSESVWESALDVNGETLHYASQNK